MPRTAITRAGEAAPRTTGAVTAALALLALWLLGHPYAGIVHDARLYTLQALAAAEPGALARDIFFLADSQGRYTLFPAAYAGLIERLGPGAAAMAATAAMQAAWLAAAAVLLRGLLSGAGLWLALAMLAVLPGAYGGYQTFAYAEPFVTPRPLAEALSLAALAATGRGRPWLAVAAHAGALAAHPLMALPGVAVTCLYRGVDDRRWWLAAAAGCAAAPALALAGVPPLARLLQPMDPAWFAVVESRSAYLLPTQWRLSDWSRAAFDLAVFAVAFRFLGAHGRRLVLAVAAVAVAGVGASLLLGDLARSVLVLQLQPWRALWLSHVLGYAGLAVVIRHARPHRPLTQAAALLLAAGWLTGAFGAVAPALLVAAVAVGLVRDEDVSARTAHLVRRAAGAFAALGAAAWLGLRGWSAAALLDAAQAAELPLPWARSLGAIAPLVLAALAGALAWRRRAMAPTPLAAVMAVVALIAAGALWDRRTPWDTYVESGPPGAGAGPDVDAPAGAGVYWPGESKGAWLLLRRANYISSLHGAPVVFSRRLAATYDARMAAGARALGHADPYTVLAWQAPSNPRRPAPDAQSLRRFCARPDAPGALILPIEIGALPAKPWRPPHPRVRRRPSGSGWELRRDERLFVYDCTALSRAGRDEGARSPARRRGPGRPIAARTWGRDG